MRRVLALFLTLFTLRFAHSDPSFSVTVNEGNWTLLDRKDTESLVWGYFGNTQNANGWNVLEIFGNSSAKVEDRDMAFAAGFLEGAVTWRQIYSFWQNFVPQFEYGIRNWTNFSALHEWTRQNYLWMREQINSGVKSESKSERQYWRQVELVFYQLEGLTQGYNAFADDDKKISVVDFMMLNGDGDLLDVSFALQFHSFQNAKSRHQESTSHEVAEEDKERVAFTSDGMLGFWAQSLNGTVLTPASDSAADLASVLSREEAVRSHIFKGRCSALIKVTPDLQHLFCGHNTWDTYGSMNRIYKIYHLPYKISGTHSQSVSFSSSPGFLSSVDDFFVLSSGLVVTETSTGFLTSGPAKLITPDAGLMSWVRTIVANRMALDGEHWTEIFSVKNSGTYNNQWIVVDTNRFEKGKELKRGTLWVLEQLPGLVEAKDMTSVLKNEGYFASYNVPLFSSIRNESGYDTFASSFGKEFEYQQCARARIFRRKQANVSTLSDFKSLMRYNQWQTDAESQSDACQSIAGRCDLNKPFSESWDAFGAIDAKVTEASLVKDMIAFAINGPTNQNQPSFAWSDNELGRTKHVGQPSKFDFDWVLMKPMSKDTQREARFETNAPSIANPGKKGKKKDSVLRGGAGVVH